MFFLKKSTPGFYLVHIRKTGGTFFSHAMLMTAGLDGAEGWRKLVNSKNHAFKHDKKLYIGWDLNYARKKNFFYCFSHTPFWDLNFSNEKIYISIFRDPVARLISHYKMLMDFAAQNSDHPCMLEEGPWLGKSFGDFLANIPKEHLQRQLFMFSKNFNIDEALHNISKVKYVVFLNNINRGIEKLAADYGLDIPIPAKAVRQSRFALTPTESELQKLNELLGPEIQLYNALKEIYPA